MENKTILITGGSGFIGKPLTHLLLQKGYKVRHLSRNEQSEIPHVRVFKWDPEKQLIDKDCIMDVDVVIHLAGAGIAEKRWSEKRKQEIMDSRTKSISLIYDLLVKKAQPVKAVISASAVGYYGNRGDALLDEGSAPGDGFLSSSTIAWEKAVDKGNHLGLRVVKLRTGLVLSDQGGALPQLAKSVKAGLGSALGSGNQWTSWIHLNDAIAMYVFAVENEQMNGAFNMATTSPVRNKQLISEIAKALKKPLWLPNVPGFALKLALGEMSAVVLDSTKVAADKIVDTGFRFQFPGITDALNEIYVT